MLFSESFLKGTNCKITNNDWNRDNLFRIFFCEQTHKPVGNERKHIGEGGEKQNTVNAIEHFQFGRFAHNCHDSGENAGDEKCGETVDCHALAEVEWLLALLLEQEGGEREGDSGQKCHYQPRFLGISGGAANQHRQHHDALGGAGFVGGSQPVVVVGCAETMLLEHLQIPAEHHTQHQCDGNKKSNIHNKVNFHIFFQ